MFTHRQGSEKDVGRGPAFPVGAQDHGHQHHQVAHGPEGDADGVSDQDQADLGHLEETKVTLASAAQVKGPCSEDAHLQYYTTSGST